VLGGAQASAPGRDVADDRHAPAEAVRPCSCPAIETDMPATAEAVRPCKLPSPHRFLQTLEVRPKAELGGQGKQRARVVPTCSRWAFLVVAAQASSDEKDGRRRRRGGRGGGMHNDE
jgi:hypothetical protein